MTDPAEIEKIFAQYDDSDLTQKDFAEWAGVPHSTFTLWLRRRRRRSMSARQDWVEAKLPKSLETTVGGIVIEIPNGLKVRLDCVAQGDLVQILQSAASVCLH